MLKRVPPSPQDVARRAAVLHLVVAWAQTYTGDTPGRPGRARKVLLAEAERLKPFMSLNERRFVQPRLFGASQEGLIYATWRLEAYQCLLWALGLIEALPPSDQEADRVRLMSFQRQDLLESGASMRDQASLEKARTTAELWHWRTRNLVFGKYGSPLPEGVELLVPPGEEPMDYISRETVGRYVDEGLINETIDGDLPAFGKPFRDVNPYDEFQTVNSISGERHFAFNWLCGLSPGNRWDETPIDTGPGL